MEKTIVYGGQLVSVSHEVADYLEQDEKRQDAEARSDRRHRCREAIDPDTLGVKDEWFDPVFEVVYHKLLIDKLREVISRLTEDERELLYLRFWQEMTLQSIADRYSLSKMAISKRLRKLLAKMKGLMNA